MVPRFQGFIRTFVIICTGVFILQTLLKSGNFGGHEAYVQLIRILGLLPEYFFRGAVYQPITWIFLHGSFMHLLFNMFAFWMFGSLLESALGHKQLLRFVFITGYLSGLIVAISGFFDPMSYALPTIGASGVIFAVLMAVSRLFPNQIILLFFIFPIKMRYFAYLMIVIEFYALYSSNQQGISNIAHLGGALVGYLYISFLLSGRGMSGGRNWFSNLRHKWHQRRMRKKLKVVRANDNRMYH